MQISYKPVSGGAYAVLLDTGAAAAFDAASIGPAAFPEFSPSFTGNTQEETIAALTNPPSTATFRAPRGNVKGSLSVAANVPYGSLANALASLRTYAALLNTQNHLKVVQDTETQYYPNAILTEYNGALDGTSVHHKMKFLCDLVTSTAP